MKIELLTDYPALFISDKRLLVIADLHLGLEHELYKSGIVIHSQADKFQKTIEHLLKTTKAKTLIILGDIKHKVPGISFREEKEIPKLLNNLVEKVKIILVRGNHDTLLKDILPSGVSVKPSCGFRISTYGFFHGHAWPSKLLMSCNYLFMGHVHPAVEFVDSFGYRLVEQVWIKGMLNADYVKKKYGLKKTGKLKTIVLPAFNKLLGGLPVNTTIKEDLIGPLLANRFMDIDRSKIYLLDGTYLGETKNLKRLA
jgi:putative SbcD/Mre11-related phosphoesterase